MEFKPHDYQQYAIEYIETHEIAAILLDMGLGKTVQTLALLLREMEQGRAVCALVVCPASLQLNWRGEAAKFAPDLPCEVLMGTAAARQKQDRKSVV